MSKGLKPGDKVSWNTPQGQTHGKVTKTETTEVKAGGHIAKASPAEPQYRVESSKSGKEAVHKAGALTKR